MRQFGSIFLILFTLLTLPLVVFAAEFRSGDSVTISQGETIADDLYIASGTITVDGTINGDLYIAGGNIRVNGTVTEDLVVAGGTVDIRGTVQDDIRVAGGQVIVAGQVADDVFAAGGDVTIANEATVSGLTNIAGGQATIAGTTQDVQANIGNLSVADTAVINGDLTYKSPETADIAAGAEISGEVTQQTVDRGPLDGRDIVLTTLVSILVTAVLAFLFLLLIPNKAMTLVRDARERFGLALLWGLLFLVVTPFVIFILFISIFGIPLALVLLALYLVMVYLGNLTAVLIAGTWLARLLTRDENYQPNFVAALLGAIVLALLGLIPVIGWLAVFIAVLVGLGTLIRYDTQLYSALREGKQL